MNSKQQFRNSLSRTTARAATAALAMAILFALAVVATAAAQAPTYKVIHTFTGGGDGGRPETGLTMDAAGDLYGTTAGGGASGNGTVFRLRKSGSGWVLNTLYSFSGGSDGAYPESKVALARDGTLYGTTSEGGGTPCNNGRGCGTIFHLTPSPAAPRSALAPRSETVLYRFTGGSDGEYPLGNLTFDQSGNIYGTTFYGGINGNGVIYELLPSGGGWTETVLYSAQNNGANPCCGVIFDKSGNLYGVFSFGGPGGAGTVFQLSPSGSGWTEQTLYGFSGGSDGGVPQGGLTFDSSGNLYGTTSNWASGNGGTVFDLKPSSGGWTFSTLYAFFFGNGLYGGPEDELVLDAAGNLYGTTFGDGSHLQGSVFELTPSNGGWTYIPLQNCGVRDGDFPRSDLVFDVNGNLYGTTWTGGSNFGVAFEITP